MLHAMNATDLYNRCAFHITADAVGGAVSEREDCHAVRASHRVINTERNFGNTILDRKPKLVAGKRECGTEALRLLFFEGTPFGQRFSNPAAYRFGTIAGTAGEHGKVNS
jgi:hypothetical protein